MTVPRTAIRAERSARSEVRPASSSSTRRGARAARRGCPARRSCPASITRIMSASRIVESRCAMMKLVRSRRSWRVACWISTSVRVSTELVASSRISSCGLGEHGPGDRDQLLLAGADVRAAVVDPGLVAVGQGLDEAVDVGRPGRLDHLLFGRRRGARRRCCRRRCRRTARCPAAPSRCASAANARLTDVMSTPSSSIRPESTS